MELPTEALYRAVQTRDARFDGRFFTGVVTTGVFCRPTCPSRTPREKSCVFFANAAQAQAAGFRACLRCRPEVAPTVAAYNGSAALVSRALRLLDEGALDEAGVEPLADRLGVGARQLRRLFLEHLGAPPVQVAQARRALFAKALLHETALPVGDVALAAGFGSLRRFNSVMKRALGRAPTEMRRRAATELRGRAASDVHSSRATGEGSGITLRLPCSQPYDWPGIASFLGGRAIPGVEEHDARGWRRTLCIDGAAGVVEVRPLEGALQATVHLSKLSILPAVVSRLRRLFDLDADIAAIAARLSRDALLKPLVKARPGLRVPGAWDAFELAVRAILGQQISVAGARTLAGRLAERYGEPLPPALAQGGLQRIFPTAERLAREDLANIGMPRARSKSLEALAKAAAADPRLLAPEPTLDASIAKLTKLPGIGPWTAHYIALRALGEPDAWPTGDLGLLRATGLTAAELDARAEAFRPWRAYAVLHLWTGEAK